MDIPRAKKPDRRRWIYIGAGITAVLLITFAFSRLEPAPPTVERAAIWTDTVQQGEMVREVRGPGTLVPEQIRWIPAVTAGRVERVFAEPGMTVDSGTVLVELSNADVQREALEAQRQMVAAEADLMNLRATLENQRLNQEASVAQTRSQYREAMRQVKANEQLAEKDLVAPMELQRIQDQAQELEERLGIEQKRLSFMSESMKAQLAAQRAQVERMHSLTAFQQEYVQSMRVVAGTKGVLRELPLQEGQWVNPGDRLAVVVQPGRLKAELRVPETQARDVVVGLPAKIDTRNGIIDGRVVRVDPAVENGTVTVDVALDGELPRGARPDLSVDGTIQIERLENVLHVGRPAYGQAESTVGLFKVVDGGDAAVRTPVRLGRSSVNTIEIRDGLAVGDIVILSDMSQWDSADRVRMR